MRRISRRWMFWSALSSAVLGTALLLATHSRSDRPVRQSMSEPEDLDARDGRDPTGRDIEAGPRRVVAVPVIEVVDAVDGSPLVEATLTWIPPGVPPRTLVEPVLARADEVGRILVPKQQAERPVFVVRGARHVPAVIEGEITGVERVSLSRAAILRVTMINAAGTPVEGGAIVLDVDGTALPDSPPAPGIGHPLAQRPLWSGCTGPVGMAVFDELPVGTFYLSAFHDTLVPATSVGSHSRHFVVGDDAVTVTMEELFGVVFECPTEAAVESASWNVPLLSLDLSPRIVSRLARARAALESRFPGSHVYVHQPRHPEDPPSIELRIAASDGTFWRGEWTLCRLGEIDQPVYMESVAPVGVARLTIRVLNRSGTPIAGFPLVVGNRETGHRVHTESGCELQCPYGRYGVFARNLGWTFRSFGGLQGVDLLVSEQTPEVVDIQLDLDLVEVEIRLLLPTPDPVNKLTISLDDEHGAGPVVANWAPARGPVRLHAPAGPLRVRVNSNGAYEPVDRWFTVPAVNERVCFEVPLVDSPASGR